MQIFQVSATTGAGLDIWYKWLTEKGLNCEVKRKFNIAINTSGDS
jgi:hypothetical protein